MLFIIGLFVAGGIYGGLSRASGAFPLIAASAIIGTALWYVLMGFVWFNDLLFITPVINESLQFLSGVEVYGQVEGNLIIMEDYCDHYSGEFWPLVGRFALTLLNIVLSFLLIFPGVAAVVMAPIGIISCIVGAIAYLFTRDKEAIRYGLVPLMVALVSIIAAGLLGRVIHTLSMIASCA